MVLSLNLLHSKRNDTMEFAYEQMKIKSVSSFPVIDKKNKVVGIVTNRDFRSAFFSHLKLVSSIMTQSPFVVKVNDNSFYNEKELKNLLLEAKQSMIDHKIERILLVNKQHQLIGMICMKDILNDENYPIANKDKQGRLRVGAAISTNEIDVERAKVLKEADVDVLVIDTAHGHHKNVIDILKKIKSQNIDIDVIVGNIASQEAAQVLIENGADAIKVGIGPGSICTTRVVSGVGVPQVTAILNVCEVAKKHNIPVIADGGIKHSGDITKALALGSDSVMLGSIFASANESPGETILIQGKNYKIYRGMGSLSAMERGSKARYNQGNVDSSKLVPEGVEASVPVHGNLESITNQLIGGIQAGMGYCGAKDLTELKKVAKFMQISNAGLQESHVHDVIMIKDAPNYTQSK